MKFRKVKFYLNPRDGFLPDQENPAPEEEKDGLFHCWAPSMAQNPQTGAIVPGVIAIIEDIADSQLHELPLSQFNFVHPAEFLEID